MTCLRGSPTTSAASDRGPDYTPGPISATAFIGSDTPDSVTANNQSTAVINVIGSADLAITKQGPANLVAGGEAAYALTVVNNGPSDATTVAVTDTLPADLTLISVSPAVGTCSAAGPQITCSATGLAAGSSLVVNLKVGVSTTAGTSVGNTANVGAATPDPVAGNNTATVTTPVTQAAHLVLSKTGSPSPLAAGASITYALTIANAGPSNATTVGLDDALPNGLLVLPDSVTVPADGTCTVSTDRTDVECTFNAIPAGQSRVVTLDALVPAGTPGGSTITNTTTITSATTDPDSSTRTASVTTPVTTVADVAILKTPLDVGVDAGDLHGYLLAVSNNGPSVARAVTIADPLPPGTTFVSAVPTNGSCGQSSGAVSCAIGDLNPGQVVTVQLTIQLAANLGETTLTNTATTASPTTDPDGSNNSSTVAQVVTRRADLALTKTISSGPVVAGSPLTYTLTLPTTVRPTRSRAHPRSAAGGYELQLGHGQRRRDVYARAGRSDDDANDPHARAVHVGAAHGREHATASTTLVVADDTAAGTVVANTATADSRGHRPDAGVGLGRRCRGRQQRHAGRGTAPVGDASGHRRRAVRWQIVARNAGPWVATGVTVADVAPAGVTFNSVTSTAGICTIGASPLCTLDTVAVGTSVTITLAGTIASDYAAASLTNTAAVASTSADPDPSNNGAATPHPSTRAPISPSRRCRTARSWPARRRRGPSR